MRLLIINGPNLNMLGKRNQQIYGKEDYKTLIEEVKKYCKRKGVQLTIYQSNSESKIITKIQKSLNKYDGYIVNLGAYTHYSYAIRDALEIVKKPIIEVHLTDVNNREEFRKVSVLEGIRLIQISGKGKQSYFEALDCLLEEKSEQYE